MSAVIQLPNPINLRAGMEAVRERAKAVGASSDALRRALATLFREMQAGRSTAASVAVANGTLRERQASASSLPPSAA
jgi:hypothetical protein